MTRRDLAKERCDLDMTPMIDVTFLLLIFFMCTLRFKTLEGKLAAHLPQGVGQNPEQDAPIEKIEVLVRVTSAGDRLHPGPEARIYRGGDDGRFVYGPGRSLEYRVGPFRTSDPAALARHLRGLHRSWPSRSGAPQAAIGAGPQVVYEDVVTVLDLLLEAGFRDVLFLAGS